MKWRMQEVVWEQVVAVTKQEEEMKKKNILHHDCLAPLAPRYEPNL